MSAQEVGPRYHSMEHLALGNEVRQRRVMLKRDVQAGRLSLVDVLEPHPEHALAKLPVRDLLCWPKRWGTARARAVMDGVCSEWTLVGQLTLRQRAALIDRIEHGTLEPGWRHAA